MPSYITCLCYIFVIKAPNQTVSYSLASERETRRDCFNIVRLKEITFDPMVSIGIRTSGSIKHNELLDPNDIMEELRYRLIQKAEPFLEYRLPFFFQRIRFRFIRYKCLKRHLHVYMSLNSCAAGT